MQKDGLDSYSMAELIDLLAKSTKELLILMNRKTADGILLTEKRKQVQLLQAVIDQRRLSGKQKQ